MSFASERRRSPLVPSAPPSISSRAGALPTRALEPEVLLALARLAAAAGALDDAAVEEEARALAGRVSRRAAQEALLQTYLFAGFPAAINGLAALERAWPAPGAGSPRPFRSTRGWTPELLERWRSRGEELCARIYGPAYGRLRARMRALSPDLDEWMLVEGYGKTLARRGLPFAARELCALAVLAATGAARQLAAHLEGAERAGLDRRLAIAAAREGASRHLRPERRAAVETVLAAAERDGA